MMKEVAGSLPDHSSQIAKFVSGIYEHLVKDEWRHGPRKVDIQRAPRASHLLSD